MLIITFQLSVTSAGFFWGPDLSASFCPCSSRNALPGHSWLLPNGTEQAARFHSHHSSAKTWPSHRGDMVKIWLKLCTGEEQRVLSFWFCLILLRFSLAVIIASLRVITDLAKQLSVHLFFSPSVCGMTSAAFYFGLMGPSRGLDPQLVAFKPGLEPSTSLVRIGETEIAKVMASSGQSTPMAPTQPPVI